MYCKCPNVPSFALFVRQGGEAHVAPGVLQEGRAHAHTNDSCHPGVCCESLPDDPYTRPKHAAKTRTPFRLVKVVRATLSVTWKMPRPARPPTHRLRTTAMCDLWTVTVLARFIPYATGIGGNHPSFQVPISVHLQESSVPKGFTPSLIGAECTLMPIRSLGSDTCIIYTKGHVVCYGYGCCRKVELMS